MLVAACSPTSSIFSEMLELNAMREESKRGDLNYEQYDTAVGEFDAAKNSPVFYGRYGHKIATVESVTELQEGDDGVSTRSSFVPEFDPATVHPAMYGYVLLDRKPPVPAKDLPPLPNPKECKMAGNCLHIL